MKELAIDELGMDELNVSPELLAISSPELLLLLLGTIVVPIDEMLILLGLLRLIESLLLAVAKLEDAIEEVLEFPTAKAGICSVKLGDIVTSVLTVLWILELDCDSEGGMV